MNLHKFYLPIVVVLSVLVAVGAISWLKAHDALRDALAQKDVMQAQSDQLKAQSAAAVKAEKTANDALEVARNKPATIQTITKYLPAQLPTGSQLVIQSGNDAGKTPQLALTGDVQKNLQAIQSMELSCQECGNSLKARDQQVSDLQKQLTLSDQNAKNWEKAARSGTGFWARTKEWGLRLGFAAGGYAAGRIVK